VLVPRYTRGTGRRINPAYKKRVNELARARRGGDRAKSRDLLRQMRSLPSQDLVDPGYRRLRYSRYADDQLLGFTGPKAEAEEIKRQLATFLRDELRLELNAEKTLVTHARTRAARYLGYAISVQHCDSKMTRGKRGRQRSANGRIKLSVPSDVIKAKCAPYRRHGKPERRTTLINLDDHTIVQIYGAEYRGIVQYYLLAHDVSRLNQLRWNAETSMLKTLAAKHHSTVTKMAARHRAKITTPHGVRTCFEARVERDGKGPLVTRFGGIPLTRQRGAILNDRTAIRVTYPGKELITRLRRGKCELCQRTDSVHVHQVRKLADLTPPGSQQSEWMILMARMRRKTLIVCQTCHDVTHNDTPTATLTA
jgi:hypothetical protein